jgi:hypothetical protein
MVAKRRMRETRIEVVSFIVVLCALKGSELDVFLDSKSVIVAIRKDLSRPDGLLGFLRGETCGKSCR